MKLLPAALSALAVLLVPAALTVACATPAPAEAEDWASHLEIRTSAVAGDAGRVEVTLQGKEGWYVNTAYPGIKVTLTAPEGATLAKDELGRAEVKYEEPHPGDKAKRAVFRTGLKGAEAGASLQGRYKLVMCSPSTCSPPFKGSFQVPVKAAE